MKLLKSLILLTPTVLSLSVSSPLSASSLQQGLKLVNNIGMQAGKLYCSGRSAEESFEKGTMIGMAETSLSIDEINKLDFEDDAYSIPMIETMFSYTIDNCPGRAKGLFRSITEME